MENLINYTLQNLLSQRNDLFGDDCNFLYFKNDESFSSSDGLNSSSKFGQIAYIQNNREYFSESLLLKRNSQEAYNEKFKIFAFLNESIFYSKILPFFESSKSIRYLFPKFYCCHIGIDKVETALLVFENIQAKGFVRHKSRTYLNYEQLLLAMRKLGEFHAVSYRIKRTDPDTFYALVSCLTETHFSVVNKNHYFLQMITQRGIKPLQNDPQYSDKIANVENLSKKAEDFFAEVLTGDKENPVSVLCHGDFVKSNLLFKYDDSGKPVHVKFLDLADCRFASPVIDLASILYINTPQKLRSEHWDDLINEYYNSLCEHCSIDDLPTKEVLLNEFHMKVFYAYIASSYFLPQVIAFDTRQPSVNEIIYEKFGIQSFKEASLDILSKVIFEVGGSQTTEALADILKDMIDRGFV